MIRWPRPAPLVGAIRPQNALRPGFRIRMLLGVGVGATFPIGCSGSATEGVTGSLPPEAVVSLEATGILGPGEEAAFQRRLESDYQAGLMTCMETSGFDYEPVPVDDTVAIYDGPGRWTLESAETYGYFMSTQSLPDIATSEAVRTNLEFAESLGPTGRQRWEAALSDCQANTDYTVGDVELEEFTRRRDDALATVRDSAAWSELNASWQDCASAVGFSDVSMQDMLDRYEQAADRVHTNPTISDAEIEAIQSDERNAAVQTWQCNAAFSYGLSQLIANELGFTIPPSLNPTQG